MMKTQMLILVALLFNSILCADVPQVNKSEMSKQTVSVLYTSDLEPLAAHLSEASNAANSDLNISITQLTGNDANLKDDHLFLLSDHDLVNSHLEDNWKVVIGRSVVVPVINKNNTFYNEILKQGVSVKELTKLLQNPQNRNWKDLLGESFDAPLQIYVQNNRFVETCLNNLLNTDKSSWSVQFINDGNELRREIGNDKNAIAFCQLSNISGLDDFKSELNILPIDKNANNTIDQAENIYKDASAFQRGVWIGKYPKSLYTNLYLASEYQPAKINEIEFIKWVITQGQPLIADNGYQTLVYSEIPSKLAKLHEPLQLPIDVKPNPFVPGYVIILGILFIAVIVGIELWIRTSRKQKTANNSGIQEIQKALSINNIHIPQGIYFDKTHTWAFMEKNGIVRLGIDDFLTHVSGPFTRVIMKSEGEKINKGEHMLTIIQKGKQIKVNAPVSGTIRSFNNELVYNVTKLNSVPYDEGWVYLITPDKWNKELRFLSGASSYKDWIATEFIRFKDFITNVLRGKDITINSLVLQDGGEIAENVLSNLGPDVWEDFQNQFLERS